ncbi:unnamed protein product [Arabis nemorensis]|uniref:NYN domain-containing protein n=1 Tax=Arabis nemorensis TaxID=586526 RepID=A0A565BCT0_9BRAS|nr:unnamed protein product [Arabis nemorensis]
MEKIYENAKTAVFWDIGSCDVPDGVDVDSITSNIRSALSNMKYFGPISFFAYGDTTVMKEEIVDEISRTIFLLQQVKGEGDRFHAFGAIAMAMFFWAKHNPGPANFLLISGNKDFSYALTQFRKSGCNVLLGHPKREASGPLTRKASAVWHSETLLAGGSPLPFSPKWKTSHKLKTFEYKYSDTSAASSFSSPKRP